MYVFTLLFIFGGIRYVGALRSRLFLSLSAAISQSERYTTHIFPFKPLLFYCRRPSLSLLSLRRSSSSGSSFSGSFSHERTIENSVEGGGEGAVRTLPCLRIHFIHLPLISLSLSHFVTFLLLAVLLQVLLRHRYHPARPPLRPLAPPSPSLRRLPPAVLLLVLQLLVLLLDLLLCKFEGEGKFDGKEGRGLGRVRVQV